MNDKESLIKNTTWISIFLGFISLISTLIMVLPVYYATVLIFSITSKADASPEKTAAVLTGIALIFTTVLKLGCSLTNIILGFKTRKTFKLTNDAQKIKKYSLTTLILSLVLSVCLITSFFFDFSMPFIKWIDLGISLCLIFNCVLIFVLLRKKETGNNETIKDAEIEIKE